MAKTRVHRIRTRRLAAASVLSAAALLSAAACSDAAQAGPPPLATTHSPTATVAATGPGTTVAATATSPGAPNTESAPAAGKSSTTAAHTPPQCGNGDLTADFGHGSTDYPHQSTVVIFTNVSRHTCTLRGYPGAAIVDGARALDAARVLNGYMGDIRHLESPPPATIAPGATASATLEWLLADGQACYPTGTGSIEVTAPNTTKTFTLSTGATLGRQGICSTLQINPLVPGTIG